MTLGLEGKGLRRRALIRFEKIVTKIKEEQNYLYGRSECPSLELEMKTKFL